MRNFISLTENGTPVCVNVQNIVYVRPDNGGSTLFVTGNNQPINVSESFEEVVSLIAANK